MRLTIVLICLIVLSASIVFAGNILHLKDNGQEDNTGDDDSGPNISQNHTQELEQIQSQQGDNNQTNEQEQEFEKNQTREQDQEKNKTKEQERELNQTREQEKDKNQTGNGISEQVHQIMEAKKNGSLTVPPGFIVRIIAHNHTLSVENATEILNRTLNASFWINGKNKTLRFETDDDHMNITDDNVTVETNETLDIENETLSVGGKKVLVMPSEVPAKIKAKTIKSAVLHIVDGDPVYQVNSTRRAQVLWVFGADMDVESTVDANSGNVTNEKGPWWKFLVTSEGD